MRVRWQRAGEASQTQCDMTEKAARKKFEKLKTDALCEWAELIGEDDDNYMEVLEDFDQTKLANIMKSIIG